MKHDTTVFGKTQGKTQVFQVQCTCGWESHETLKVDVAQEQAEEHERLAAAPAAVAGPGRDLLAIGPFCWGRGKTEAQAVRNAKKSLTHYTTGTYHILIVDAPEGAWVTGMGGVQWEGAPEPGAKNVAIRTFTKRRT